MRRLLLRTIVGLLFFAAASFQVQAQSGSRGSGSRMGPRPSYGTPSRVGGSRSKAIRSNALPTGMMNSANAARMNGGMRSTGSGSRPTTGYSSRNSLSPSAGGAQPVTTGLPRPARSKPRASSSGAVQSNTMAGTAAPPASIPDGYRLWTDASGRYSMHGQLAAQRDGVVWLRRLDGKLAKLRATQLSTQDQTFLSGTSGG